MLSFQEVCLFGECFYQGKCKTLFGIPAWKTCSKDSHFSSKIGKSPHKRRCPVLSWKTWVSTHTRRPTAQRRGTVPHFVGVNCARRGAVGARVHHREPRCHSIRRGGGVLRALRPRPPSTLGGCGPLSPPNALSEAVPPLRSSTRNAPNAHQPPPPRFPAV